MHVETSQENLNVTGGACNFYKQMLIDIQVKRVTKLYTSLFQEVISLYHLPARWIAETFRSGELV
jgi:hypothetical protein